MILRRRSRLIVVPLVREIVHVNVGKFIYLQSVRVAWIRVMLRDDARVSPKARLGSTHRRRARLLIDNIPRQAVLMLGLPMSKQVPLKIRLCSANLRLSRAERGETHRVFAREISSLRVQARHPSRARLPIKHRPERGIARNVFTHTRSRDVIRHDTARERRTRHDRHSDQCHHRQHPNARPRPASTLDRARRARVRHRALITTTRACVRACVA
mmetsp:Transcript_2362/g.7547  ORF Transcript_2362/g.7547 Transcript_2362/m.7547 type:complete len:214 (-) Transcript_2362:36-677(-)